MANRKGERVDTEDITLDLPENVYRKLEEFAARAGISVEAFVISAVRERVAAMEAEYDLTGRAVRGNRDAFLNVLDKAPDVPPLPGDERP